MGDIAIFPNLARLFWFVVFVVSFPFSPFLSLLCFSPFPPSPPSLPPLPPSFPLLLRFFPSSPLLCFLSLASLTTLFISSKTPVKTSKMMTTMYLEQLLSSLESLPSELQRSYSLMRELDLQVQATLNELHIDCAAFLKDIHKLPHTERHQRLMEFQKRFAELMEFSDQKLHISAQSYETLDNHIRQLDSDINTFEAEARKRPGYQQDSEEEVLEDLAVDPNEPTYCICHQVSYGEMVGCENEDCPIQWFHYGCVNLYEKPKGAWYCYQCRARPNTPDVPKPGVQRHS
eukprot:m.123251 g.123251  ORF g.123251 m.123251 type:complete len:288 (-) comp15565_c0_seq2:45-908(-)